MSIDIQALTESAHRDGIGKVVVGAVIHHLGQVLILRRSTSDDFLPGIEELPSGGVDAGETLLEGLARELAEEVGRVRGLDLDPDFVSVFDYVSGSGRRARQYTFALPYDGAEVVLSDEHTAYRWVQPDQLGDSDLTEESKQTIREWSRSATRGA
ncbi:NUDIX domain-containing protein [Nocardiopsis dassonvillei]